MVAKDGSDGVRWLTTTADAEDAGAAAGWSIANTFSRRAADATTSFTAQGDAALIRVSGTVDTGPVLSPPTAPRSLTATPGDGRVTLQWTAPADNGSGAIVRYEVRRAEGNSVPMNTAWQSAGLNLSHTVTGLDNDTAYTFEVRAVNSATTTEGPAARVQATPTESPLVSLTPGRLIVAEDVGTIVLTVSLDRRAESALSVSWHTQDERANAPNDYTAREGPLTFAAGDDRKTISVPIVDDAVREDPVQGVLHETFFVVLSPGDGYRLSDSSYALVEIVDNDGDAPPDVTPPQLTQVTANGSTLVLTYNEPLDGTSTPAPGDFAVTVTGSPVGFVYAIRVNAVRVIGATVTLTLAAAVQTGQGVTVGYTPGVNPIQDAAGNDAAALTANPVTDTPDAPPPPPPPPPEPEPEPEPEEEEEEPEDPTPVPALPLAGAGLLGLLLVLSGWCARRWR